MTDYTFTDYDAPTPEGVPVTIVRALTPAELPDDEKGPCWLVRLPDGAERKAFETDLDPEPPTPAMYAEGYRVNDWYPPKVGTPCECSDCDWNGDSSALVEIDACSLTAGDASPAGRCPECHSLAYVCEALPVPPGNLAPHLMTMMNLVRLKYGNLDADVTLALAEAGSALAGEPVTATGTLTAARDMAYDAGARKITDENGLTVAENVGPQDAALLLGNRLFASPVAEIIADMLGWNANAFDGDAEVNGGDMVEAFSEWREQLVAALGAPPATEAPQVVISTGITVTTKPSPRILLVIEGGMVDTIAAEGFDFPVRLVQIDYDTDGDEDGVTKLDGTDCYLSVGEIDPMSADDSALASLAVKEWEIA